MTRNTFASRPAAALFALCAFLLTASSVCAQEPAAASDKYTEEELNAIVEPIAPASR